MQVLCGFLDPVICLFPHTASMNSQNDYINYIDTIKGQFGIGAIEKTIDGVCYGLTNDGVFYVEHDWEIGDRISDEVEVLANLNKYILFPVQLFCGHIPFKQIQFSDIWRGEKDSIGIVRRHVVSMRTPSGRLEVDRFNERDEIEQLLAGSPYRSLHMFYQIKIQKAYPHNMYRDSQNVGSAWDSFLVWYNGATVVNCNLLSQYLSEARSCEIREAFYTGIMFLEELFYHEIKKHKFAFDKTRIKKKLLARSLDETTFRNKISIIRHNNLYVVKDFKKELDCIAQLRNDVFHRGYVPTPQELFTLDQMIVYFSKAFTGLTVPSLAISIQYI